MIWATVVLSVIAALQLGFGQAQSSVRCGAIATGRSASYSKSNLVSLGADIAAQLCSPTGSEAIITASVESVAEAYAYALAETTVGCTAVGNAAGTASASVKAEAQAEATAEALFEGWVSVKTCNGCEAAAELFLSSFERVLAKAAAESKSAIEVNAQKSGRDSAARNDVVETVVHLVLPIKSELTTKVQTAIKDGEETCNVFISGCTVAGSDGGCCDLTVANTARAIEVNAIADAAVGAEAEATKCSKDSALSASAGALAEAMARAYAEAVVKVDAFCETTENSSACVWAEASQEKMAAAQARAFASAWARANSGCGCEVSLDATADAIESIYASATAEVLAEVCSDGEGLAGVSAVAKAYEEKTVEAVALALADAVVDGKNCGATATACVAAGGDEFACCDLLVDNVAESFSKDSIAEVSVLAGLFTCDGDGESSAKATAEAIAVAWAKVLTQVDTYCTSTGEASACGLTESSISATARAQAKALADAWAGTIGECGCELKLEAAVQSVTDVLVEVTLAIHRGICVQDGGVYTQSEILEVFRGARIEAIASALAKIKQEDTVCEAEVEVEATTNVCPNCDTANKRCAGYRGRRRNRKFVVWGCCDPTMECVKRTTKKGGFRGVCKPIGWTPPPRNAALFPGEVYKCPA